MFFTLQQLLFIEVKIEGLPISNHKEADTSLIFHARTNNKATVIAAKDVVVFSVLT